jgi:hypothetical protein
VAVPRGHRAGGRTSISQDIESDQVGGNWHFGDPLYDAGMARSSRTTDVTQEGLHRLDSSLNVDEDRAIGPVRYGTHHSVTIGRLHHARAVVDSLYAPVGEAVPVNEREHAPSKFRLHKSLPPAGPEEHPRDHSTKVRKEQ